MAFKVNFFSRAKKAQGKVDSVQKQSTQATDNDVKERLDSIERELMQIWQRLEDLENQCGESTDPPIDNEPPILTITPGGTFTQTKQIIISVNEPAVIYFTLDDSIPTINSAKYSTPITITSTTVLKAFAIDEAGNESTIQTVTYTFEAIEPPNNITNLHASSVGVHEIRLSWIASSSNHVIGYDVYKDGVFLIHVTTTNVLVSHLFANTEYTFHVKAKDDQDDVSSGVSITVKTKKDSEEPVDTLNLDGGSFTNTSFNRVFDGGLFMEPQSGKSVDGGEFNG